MSPTQFNDHQHAKREINGFYPSPLKINKDSHFIKKLSPSSSSSSTSSLANCMAGGTTTTKPQQRHPVIIYTHSPKIIHTHPRDFMALVQKLTGLSRSDEDDFSQPKQQPAGNNSPEDGSKNPKTAGSNDDNESSSVVTDENCGSTTVGDAHAQVNSCFVPTIFDPHNPCFSNVPLFAPSSSDFLFSNQPFYNYNTDSLFFMPNVRSSISSSSSLEGMKEFHEF
uniref:Putative VQ motif-containing protein 20 n=1 Tax=Davidia involucrata TaxID=16924 RepID=A0A5B6YV60_DAVIN